MSSNGTPKEKSKNKGDVDLSQSARGVWLVKVQFSSVLLLFVTFPGV